LLFGKLVCWFAVCCLVNLFVGLLFGSEYFPNMERM